MYTTVNNLHIYIFFHAQKFLILKSNLSIFFFVAHAFVVKSRTHCQIQGHEDLALGFLTGILWF
jgi:hypothetical protein